MKIDGRHIGLIGDGHLVRMAAGDHGAFKELFEAWRSRVLYYAWRLSGGNEAVAEDIVQEAFVLLWSRRRGLSSVLEAKAFLYSTVKNKVWHHLRDTATHQRLLCALPEAPEPVLDLDPEDDMAAVAELCGQIRQAVALLSPQARRAVELALQGMSVEQTAQMMELSVNTVKTMRQRAYRQLRQQLEHLRGLLFLLF